LKFRWADVGRGIRPEGPHAWCSSQEAGNAETKVKTRRGGAMRKKKRDKWNCFPGSVSGPERTSDPRRGHISKLKGSRGKEVRRIIRKEKTGWHPKETTSSRPQKARRWGWGGRGAMTQSSYSCEATQRESEPREVFNISPKPQGEVDDSIGSDF